MGRMNFNKAHFEIPKLITFIKTWRSIIYKALNLLLFLFFLFQSSFLIFATTLQTFYYTTHNRMVAISLFTLYNYFQRSLLINNSSTSFATLLLQAHKKLTFFQQDQTKDQQIKSNPITVASAEPLSAKDQHRLHILYPARNPVLSTDTFFSSPKVIIQRHLQQKQQQKQKKQTSYSVDVVETIKKQSQSAAPITPNYVAPREPIVLCHGLFGFDIRGPEKIPALQFHYWSGVEDTLAKLGARIIVTKVPQAGSIWERSQALHTILKSILVGKSVNFVAHSMVS